MTRSTLAPIAAALSGLLLASLVLGACSDQAPSVTQQAAQAEVGTSCEIGRAHV